MTQWVELDRQSDALVSLEMFCDSLAKATDKPVFWKYAIITIHNALQAYICMSLRGTNSFLSWREKDLKKWMTAYNNGDPLPNTTQDFFMNLFDKLFDPNAQIDRAKIRFLNKRRNELTHFNLDGWSFPVLDLHSYCAEALKAIRLAPDFANGMVFYRKKEREDFERVIKYAESLLTAKDICGDLE